MAEAQLAPTCSQRLNCRQRRWKGLPRTAASRLHNLS
jgi:hypothetical protein